MKLLLSRFVKDESGATAIEYGLIAAFISLVLVTTGPSIKTSLSSVFTKINSELATAAAAP